MARCCLYLGNCQEFLNIYYKCWQKLQLSATGMEEEYADKSKDFTCNVSEYYSANPFISWNWLLYAKKIEYIQFSLGKK